MFSIALTTVLAFTGTTTATPVLMDSQNLPQFSLDQAIPKRYFKNGPAEMAKTMRKYGRSVPENILAAAKRVDDLRYITKRATSGSASNTPIDNYDTAYLTPVTVGNTTLNLDFDTGSSDLWVYSSLQPSSQLSGRDYYTVDPSKQMQGATWNIGYADGSGASGVVYADKVAIGGVTVTTQAVEAATSVSSSFQQSSTQEDGILGLGFSNINTVRPTQQKTWFANAKLANPLFGVTLKHQAPGSYDFGYINTSRYTGTITYVNADSSNGWWQFPATGYTVGTTKTSATINGIADTGTTLFYLDSSIVAAYYAQVSGSQDSQAYGAYIFPCSSTLPNFSITIGGTSHTVPGKLFNYAQVDSTNCYGSLQSNSGIGYSIFGDVFFKSQYVVFQAGSTNRLGFAQQATS